MAKPQTPVFRVSYPAVFEPKLNELNNTMEYSLVALFDEKSDLSGLKKLAQEAIVKKWGADKAKWPRNLKTPFRDQGERAKLVDGKEVLPAGYKKGCIFITLKSKQRPGVVDRSVQPIIDASEFYAGCYAVASVSAYAYDTKGNRGVAFGLGNVQKVRDGESLGGRSKPEEDFAPIEMEGEDLSGFSDTNGLL